MWTAIFCALSAAIALLSLAVSVFAARRAARVAALPQERLRSVESRLGSIEGSIPEMQQTMEVLANRVKMQRVRTAANHVQAGSNGEPDVRSDPEAWRAWKNSQLRIGATHSG